MKKCTCDLSTPASKELGCAGHKDNLSLEFTPPIGGMTALYRVIHVTSGQFYVGISVDPVRRWKTHRKRARQGHESKFYLALQAYGADAFEFAVLDWFDTWQQAREAERLILKCGLAELNMTR